MPDVIHGSEPNSGIIIQVSHWATVFRIASAASSSEIPVFAVPLEGGRGWDSVPKPWRTHLDAVKIVVVPTIIEVSLQPMTDLKPPIGGDGNIAKIEQPVDVRAQ